MSTMKLPANYASISEEEMVYLDGGARDAYNSFLNCLLYTSPSPRD